MKPMGLTELMKEGAETEAILNALKKHNRVIATLHMPNGKNHQVKDDDLNRLLVDVAHLYYKNKFQVIQETIYELDDSVDALYSKNLEKSKGDQTE
jgi:hypothetical protein